jgi:hypothetical protein
VKYANVPKFGNGNNQGILASHGLRCAAGIMPSKSFARDLSRHVPELAETPKQEQWVFADELREITSNAASTPGRAAMLESLRTGSNVVAFGDD